MREPHQIKCTGPCISRIEPRFEACGNPRSTPWVYSRISTLSVTTMLISFKWSVLSILKRPINISHGKNSFIPEWDISNLIYRLVFKCVKAFVRQIFNRLRNLVYPRVFLFASDITSESLLPKIYNPISAHVTHRSQREPHWTKFGDFRLVLTRGVTSNSTCELVFPSFPSRDSGSHET